MLNWFICVCQQVLQEPYCIRVLKLREHTIDLEKEVTEFCGKPNAFAIHIEENK